MNTGEPIRRSSRERAPELPSASTARHRVSEMAAEGVLALLTRSLNWHWSGRCFCRPQREFRPQAPRRLPHPAAPEKPVQRLAVWKN